MERRKRRAEEALRIVAGLPADPHEALATLDEARRAYGAFLAEYGLVKQRFPRLRAWGAIALVAVLSVSLWESAELWGLAVKANEEPAFVWGEARLANNAILPGQPLEVISAHKYTKACDWKVEREFLDTKRHLLAMDTANLPPIPISHEFQRKDFRIVTPELPPGRYIFKASLKGHCKGPIEQTVKYPDLFEQNFTVIAP